MKRVLAKRGRHRHKHFGGRRDRQEKDQKGARLSTPPPWAAGGFQMSPTEYLPGAGRLVSLRELRLRAIRTIAVLYLLSLLPATAMAMSADQQEEPETYTMTAAAVYFDAGPTNQAGPMERVMDETILAVEQAATEAALAKQKAAEEAARAAEGIPYDVPATSTGVKCWMDYRTITSRSSMQWAIQQEAYTDSLGFRRYGDYYLVAMGSYYADYHCGRVFRIFLDNGASFDAMIGDMKSDAHTDPGRQHRNGNVVEFIVDDTVIPNASRRSGDMSDASDNFQGNISAIRLIAEDGFAKTN